MNFDENSEPAEPLLLQRVLCGNAIYQVQASLKWSKNQWKIDEKTMRKNDRKKHEKSMKNEPQMGTKSMENLEKSGKMTSKMRCEKKSDFGRLRHISPGVENAQ